MIYSYLVFQPIQGGLVHPSPPLLEEEREVAFHITLRGPIATSSLSMPLSLRR